METVTISKATADNIHRLSGEIEEVNYAIGTVTEFITLISDYHDPDTGEITEKGYADILNRRNGIQLENAVRFLSHYSDKLAGRISNDLSRAVK